MLINELANSNKKVLAKELRKLIEPDKAKSSEVLKESEIRKYLCKHHLTYYGISDIVSVLETNYSDKTILRLLSKIQKPVVWDTCICNISPQELKNMLYNGDVENIITTAVYDELLKLAVSSDSKKPGIYNAYNLVSSILDDVDSKFCTIVDLPKDTCVNNYVDNQLLWYCSENDYELYTHDYVLGLRAKSKGIAVTVFTSFDESEIIKYSPNQSGKNVILNIDLINMASITEIVQAAESIGANQFILTHEFVEALENINIKTQNSHLIHFFVLDTDNTYSFYLSENETTDVSVLADKYNAIVFSSDIRQCLEYKMNCIPYKLLRPSSKHIFKNRMYSALALSPYYTSDFIYEDNLDENPEEIETSETNKSFEPIIIDNSEIVDVSDEDKYKKSTSNQSIKASPILIPHYKPKKHQILVKNLSLNEKIWVLDNFGKELTPDFKNGYTALPGYTVIHVLNVLNDTFRLNVYKIVNSNTQNYSSKIVSISFTKENLNEVVSDEYKSFARRTIMLT